MAVQAGTKSNSTQRPHSSLGYLTPKEFRAVMDTAHLMGALPPNPPEFNVFDTTSAENSQGIPPGCRCSVPLGGARVASQRGLLLRIASDDGDLTLNDKAPFRALCRGKSGTQSSRSALLKASASVAFLKEGALALAVSMSPRSASISSCLTERPMRRSVGSSFTIFITRSWPA